MSIINTDERRRNAPVCMLERKRGFVAALLRWRARNAKQTQCALMGLPCGWRRKFAEFNDLLDLFSQGNYDGEQILPKSHQVEAPWHRYRFSVSYSP